ncbi:MULTISPECIES: oligosaccharide flippase family protein [unclassified Sphingomonas]|uniref:oligosaccharide flippase family protein n=1 Tax=unclassified Sphingomonas TaxID=196159 RepID=UPI00083359B5|nr:MULTISPECIES: oligosaccharide flippase family protein [unclassified Sphingomonas]
MSRIAWLRARLTPSYLLGASPIATWLRGAGWIFGSSMVERVAALVQTILIARAIGVDDYGRYGLLLSTIALASPIASLQLPYSVISIVSRFSERDPERAGAVMLLADRLTWGLTLAFLALCLVWPAGLSSWLLGESQHGWAVIFSGIILLTSVQAGLSDALLQAKQEFRVLALARSWTAAAAFMLLVPVALFAPSLNYVMAAVAAANLLRLLAVAIPARSHRRALRTGISLRGAFAHADLLLSFSLPSGLLAVVQGVAAWIGNYALSRVPSGFTDLAVINTGAQWRLPVLMVLTALASAVLPMLGASIGAGRAHDTERLQRYNLLLNLALATVFSAITIAASGLILGLYGPEFRDHRYMFALVVIAVIPTVYCNVQQQLLVARGHMWTQLMIFVPYAAIVIGGTLWAGNAITGEALAYIQLGGWMVTALVIAALRWTERSTAHPQPGGSRPDE